MKYIFLIMCSIILPIFSLKVTKPKLCINCKYFITDYDNGKYGKCSFFPYKNLYEENNVNFLVNGDLKDDDTNYYYCSTSRLDHRMCGKEGKKYKKKYEKRKKEE